MKRPRHRYADAIVTDAQTTGGFPTRDLLDDLIDVPYEDREVLRPARATSP